MYPFIHIRCTLHNPACTSTCTSQWQIQNFPKVGAPTLQEMPTYDFAKISQKLHEIERIWAHRGGAHPSCPCRSTNASMYICTFMCTFTCTHVHISMYIQCAPLHALLCACLWTPLHTTTCTLCTLILYTTSLCHASLSTIGLFRLFINAKKKKLVLFSGRSRILRRGPSQADGSPITTPCGTCAVRI